MSASDSSQLTEQAQISTDEVYKISENEAESTQNNNSGLKEEEELSERISDRNLKMMQRTFPNDARDMSFSRQHSDVDISTEFGNKQRSDHHPQSASARPLNSAFAMMRKSKKPMQDKHSFSYERSKTPIVASKTRNHSANMTKDKSTSRVRTCRVERPTHFATEASPRRVIKKIVKSRNS